MHGYRFTANIEARKHCTQLMCILKTGLMRQRCRLDSVTNWIYFYVLKNKFSTKYMACTVHCHNVCSGFTKTTSNAHRLADVQQHRRTALFPSKHY